MEGVANLLGVSKYTIYRLVKLNKLPAARVGNKWRFHRETIIEWVAAGSNMTQLERILKGKNIRYAKQ